MSIHCHAIFHSPSEQWWHREIDLSCHIHVMTAMIFRCEVHSMNEWIQKSQKHRRKQLRNLWIQFRQVDFPKQRRNSNECKMEPMNERIQSSQHFWSKEINESIIAIPSIGLSQNTTRYAIATSTSHAHLGRDTAVQLLLFRASSSWRRTQKRLTGKRDNVKIESSRIVLVTCFPGMNRFRSKDLL